MSRMRWVTTESEVIRNLEHFSLALDRGAFVALELARQAHYWVYSADHETFGPSLFLAYEGMTIGAYQTHRQAVRTQVDGVRFDGADARNVLALLTHSSFRPDKTLSAKLSSWLAPSLGERRTRPKWKFISLKSNGRGQSLSMSEKVAELAPKGLLRPITFESPSGAGFGTAEENSIVERAAVDFVGEWYRVRNWSVESCEKGGCGFDLVCCKASKVRHVEVKGIRGNSKQFLITAGEVKRANDDPHFELFLVTNALTTPQGHRYSGSAFLSKFSVHPTQFRASFIG